jgi:hypothetical protein
MEDKEYYLISFKDRQIAELLQEELADRGFKLEKILDAMPALGHVRRYSIGGTQEYIKEASGYALSRKGVSNVEKEKTIVARKP